MFALLEGVDHLEMACLADGLDDGETQAVGVLRAMVATVETVKEARGIKRFALSRVGNAQCTILYIYVDGSVGRAVQVSVAQEIAHEGGHQFIISKECPLALLVQV